MSKYKVAVTIKFEFNETLDRSRAQVLRDLRSDAEQIAATLHETTTGGRSGEYHLNVDLTPVAAKRSSRRR